MTSAKRRARALRHGFQYGLSYAAMRYFISAPEPLDPDFTWEYFTRKQPPFIQALIDRYPFPFQRRRLIARALDRSHAAGIEYHYDVSNAFYQLFLDRDFMFYSCADFESASDTLEIAQRRKADHLLGLIDPKPGERILELGCGWGAMLRHIASFTGDAKALSGMTLSQEQARYIRDNFGFTVLLQDFIEADYQPQSFDKVYSIGAMEHVKPQEILPLLRSLHGALASDGRLVQHFFSLNRDALPTLSVAAEIFFPGSILATHAYHLSAAQQAGFDVVHDSTHDYRPTLRAWFDRLVANRDKALKLVGVETYNRYLVFFAVSWVAFDQQQTTLHRLVLKKRDAS